jgi:thioesterase domain-containing protein
MPGIERRQYFFGRWDALIYWTTWNRTKPLAVGVAPDPNVAAPIIPGFLDYYHAVGAAYSIRRYPGSVDVFLSDSAETHSIKTWRHFVQGRLAFHKIPGEHHEIFLPEHLPCLAESLTEALRRAQDH